jgi:hypothetical protein
MSVRNAVSRFHRISEFSCRNQAVCFHTDVFLFEKQQKSDWNIIESLCSLEHLLDPIKSRYEIMANDIVGYHWRNRSLYRTKLPLYFIRLFRVRKFFFQTYSICLTGEKSVLWQFLIGNVFIAYMFQLQQSLKIMSIKCECEFRRRTHTFYHNMSLSNRQGQFKSS